MQEQTVRIRKANYRGMDSVVAEDGVVRAEIVPALGGKLVSLRYEPTGKEWLLDAGDRPLRTPPPGTAFTDADMSGWDECFPTIERCQAAGVEWPDHGELWSRPWRCELEPDAVVCSADGERAAYRFARRLSLAGGGRLRLEYRVDYDASAAQELPCLWAAHPQFNVDEPTAVLLPEAMRDLVCVYGGLGVQTGEPWRLPDGYAIDPETDGGGVKFYYPDAVPEGWSGLYGRDSRNYLLLFADPALVPHWGLWIDRGLCNDRSTVALEPGIGYYDSLARAAANGTALRLQPGDSFRWTLELALGCGDWTAAR